MPLVPSMGVVSRVKMSRWVFRLIVLESVSLGINKIYACEVENNDAKQKASTRVTLLPFSSSQETLSLSFCISAI